jgi:hypothetical protein
MKVESVHPSCYTFLNFATGVGYENMAVSQFSYFFVGDVNPVFACFHTIFQPT